MAALKDEEVGEIIIRPSSQGMDLLTITRKVPCMSCARARARAHMHALCAHACARAYALACADDPVLVDENAGVGKPRAVPRVSDQDV